MSEISGSPPVPKPAAISSQAPKKVPERSQTRDNASAKDQDPSSKEGQAQAPRTTEGARFDTAVQLAPSMAHLEVGDVVEGKIARIDGEGRPVLETPQAMYALEPNAGLKAKMTVEIVIQEIERKAIGNLVAKDGVKLEAPTPLTLTVTVLHAQPADAVVEGQTAPAKAPPTSQAYHAAPAASKTDEGAMAAALLAEAGIKPKAGGGTGPIPISKDAPALPTQQGVNSAIATVLNAVAESDKALSTPTQPAQPAGGVQQSASAAVSSAPAERLPQGIVLAQPVVIGEGGKASALPPFVALNVSPLLAGALKTGQPQADAPLPVMGNTMIAVVRALPGVENMTAGKEGQQPSLPHTAMMLDTPKGAFRLITPLSGASIGDKMTVMMLDVPLPDLWTSQANAPVSPLTPQTPPAPAAPQSAPNVTSAPASPQAFVAPASPPVPEAAPTPEAPKGTAPPAQTTAPATPSVPAAPSASVAPQGASITTPAPPAAMPAFMPIADYMKEWPLMDQLSQVVAQADPSAAASLNARMPSATTPQLAGATLFFLNALGMQNPRAWLGAKAEGALVKSGGGNWLDKLTQEFARLRGRTEAATGQAMEWRPHVVPFKTDDGINAFIVFDRPKDDEKSQAGDDKSDSANPQDEKKRFVVALNLKQLGPFELDALWIRALSENSGKLDLVVRVGESFDDGLKNKLKSLALSTMEASGLKGSLKFENISDSPLHSKELLGRIEQSLHHENRVI